MIYTAGSERGHTKHELSQNSISKSANKHRSVNKATCMV